MTLPFPKELEEPVLEIARRARDAGGRAYLVGGAVRDMLRGAPSKDADIEVFGLSPEALRRAVPFECDECGASFGVLKLKHLDIDVSLPRRESKTAAGHRGFDVAADPGLSVAEAASRRDFTVNAIYFDPLEGSLEDPFGGAADLEKGVLRHVSDKFREDPLRVLRGMQFAARFSLSPAPETVAMCRTMDTEGLASERMMEEWSKLVLRGVEIGRGLEFLRDAGWTRHFPELDALIECRQDPEWHPEGDVWNHTLLAMDAFAAARTGDRAEDLVVGLAVLCHDFGKPATTFSDPVSKRIKSPGHDDAGVAPALSFLRRLTNEEAILKAVPPLVRCHMRPFAMWRDKAGDAAVRRLANEVGRIDRLVRVAAADDAGRLFDRGGDSPELAWLLEKAKKLEIAASAPKPVLLGRHLIEMGLKPSPDFGKWLKACFEAQLDGAFSTLDDAKAYFKAKFAR